MLMLAVSNSRRRRCIKRGSLILFESLPNAELRRQLAFFEPIGLDLFFTLIV